MREYVVNRPEEGAMRRMLEREQSGPEGVILRLAWLAGLSRDEIAGLRWEQVSFLDERLELPDRMVPLSPELRPWLWRLWERRETDAPYVLVSERFGDRMQPESISRLARKALDRGGQRDVRLMDLRHDWIIRQLADKDWSTVARISGVEVTALQARFARFVADRPAAPPPRPEGGQVDEFKLWKVLQAERDSPAGLALWLAWQMGLQAREIAALTWDQVDFGRDSIRLPGREVPLTNAVRRLLQDVKARRNPGGDPHVLLTEHSQKPVDLPRLSRLTRSALIRGGMEHVRLMDLRRDEGREAGDTALLDRVVEAGAVSRGDAMALLGLSRTAAYARLRRLTEQGKLVRVGGKYYLAGTVVPPEEQPAAILAYLERAGFAYRQDIAALLHVQPKQCTLILKRMVAAGTLVQHGQKYLLPPPPARKAE
ncbi:type IV toxin-antitoxin system AbiEi family antitoxin domain-containing protein [uncultured Oscillibacter sp.]|uniref:type IV toxin-antitoxin system AbiEi family antitoxin domain-containing protein n=1 Tax=uncultured Oscillibacter sp. TaxID=876091 RepID=UPI0025DAD3BD|nr:type IV toxin-antitoxin system AbiEi family antitoxin domain-containing protein [uncultured Oscillibacter sp.]